MKDKMIIYQVFTRLFGNDVSSCQRNGDIVANGCGHFCDFTMKALKEIKDFGATHIWYTGIIEHATQTDYTSYGIRKDHPAIVKGKAGSPYAIKDYYDIDPDLATNVNDRIKEFKLLVSRTHKSGLKIIIDFVPNHVARQYHSDSKPEGVQDLGEGDIKEYAFDPNNNFYYIPNETFHPDFDLQKGAEMAYNEYPAKATGNDNFSASPGQNDWYETVKLNYGIDYTNGRRRVFSPTPSTWKKMLDILLFWSEKGVDGFRCDMAEMVPAEFWGWAIPQVKMQFPHIVFIAEVYNPCEYRNYIYQGGFDYLYDKVGLYDTLRGVVCGYCNAQQITNCWQQVDDIKEHMLNFLENHDEQRIASDFFAGDASKGKPALVVSSCMGRNPMMIYFGQELGERGMDEEGFSGKDGRTTIFDYWSVDTIRRWRNKGKFDGKLITEKEKDLRNYYTKILNLCHTENALKEGDFYDLMYVNPWSESFHADKCYAFVRHYKGELILIIANFEQEAQHISLQLPKHLFEHFNFKEYKRIKATDLLTGLTESLSMHSELPLKTSIPAYGAKILRFK